MIPPPGDDLDLDTLVLQAIRWRVPDRTYKTRDYLHQHSLVTMACACQRPDLLQELLRACPSQGLTEALDQAIWWYSDACVELLLKAGVVPTDSALGIVLKDNRHELLFRLLDHGGNLQARFQGEASLLHLAATHKNIEAALGLIQRGLFVDIQDAGGRTPLMKVCEHGSPETAARGQELMLQLLENRARPNTQDKRGMTALMLAASAAEPEQVQLLCLAGADLTLKSHAGLQAWEYALQAGKTQIAALLRTG
jgi:ankyrin repeat protein